MKFWKNKLKDWTINVDNELVWIFKNLQSTSKILTSYVHSSVQFTRVELL